MIATAIYQQGTCARVNMVDSFIGRASGTASRKSSVIASVTCCGLSSPLFEIANVLVRVDHIFSVIVHANHGVMRAAEKLCVADCVSAVDCDRRIYSAAVDCSAGLGVCRRPSRDADRRENDAN